MRRSCCCCCCCCFFHEIPQTERHVERQKHPSERAVMRTHLAIFSIVHDVAGLHVSMHNSPRVHKIQRLRATQPISFSTLL